MIKKRAKTFFSIEKFVKIDFLQIFQFIDSINNKFDE